jgi:hypothetical protein
MTWDVDSESTTAMMQDVGVSVLAADDQSSVKNIKTMAEIYSNSMPLNNFPNEISVEVSSLYIGCASYLMVTINSLF